MAEVNSKIKIFLLLFLSLCPLGGEEVVRVASFNLRNYLSCDRMVEGKWRPDYPKPEIEKKAARTIIRSVNPDILALQEMGDYPYLLELWMDLNSTGGPYYPHAVWMPNKGEGEIRHLAFLSKYPPVSIFKHTDVSFSYFDGTEKSGRGLLEVTFCPQNESFHIFNVHLKSMWTERKDDPQARVRREKEARAMRDIIRKKYSIEGNTEYLIMGDFNDHKDSAPLRRFTSVNDTVLSSLIPCFDSRGHLWTHYFKKQDSYSRIDYILANPAMANRFIPKSGWIMDSEESKYASDHRLIYADFSF
ncbi:MAG: endonuclease/exonuclease/phosphatase family protein [Opitutae bacterium]|nr:endonuclease/exonuclease/phosphatase family protein [Opitutae bacterium]MBT5717491.1 endonuclease/exonuclease/phosphatase family protein [Opitutae bacterium]